ncbi:MAG: hypothetical protein ABIS86_20150 [Streptosporangiaceae bacterium]
MSGATPLPRTGEVFFDARGDDRALRLSWHPDAGVMVISVWNRGTCTATFRLPAGDVPGFVEAMSVGLPQVPRGRRHAGQPLPPAPLPPETTAADPDDLPLTGQYQRPRR